MFQSFLVFITLVFYIINLVRPGKFHVINDFRTVSGFEFWFY